MDRILVTGATGAVGPQIVRILRDAGYSIRTLSADPADPDLFPGDVEALVGDITDASVVDQAVRDVDMIVHMASLLHINAPAPGLAGLYEKVNVEGTKNVVRAAVRENVRRIIFFSTINVYGATSQIITESTPLHPTTYYARTKALAERVVLEARDRGNRPIGTVLRFGAIYGARMKGNYRRLLMSLHKGRFAPVGKGGNRRTLIYDKDVARAVLCCLENPVAAGRTYNVSDGSFHTLRDIITVMCRALGRPFPKITLPLGPVRQALFLLDSMARLFQVRLPLGRDTIEKYTEDIAVDSQLIRSQLGFETKYNLTSGMEETVRMMKQSGLLLDPMQNEGEVARVGGNFAKRFFDILAASLLLGILSVPMLVIAMAVKTTSRGTVLYWSDRVGLNNRIFRMPKFRTMTAGTPVVATHLLDDPTVHVTRAGSFLRKFSLDELPQLWSVLKGDMSLVGPRPALYNQDDLIALRTSKGVHRLVPGITGWAQINGRDDIPIPLKVELDVYYMEHRSISFDFKVLYLTVVKAMKAEGVKH